MCIYVSECVSVCMFIVKVEKKLKEQIPIKEETDRINKI